MEKPDLSGASPEIVKYIDYLEGRGVAKLQLSLAHVCDVLADDIESAVRGSKELLLLSSDDKTFQNLLSIIKAKKEFDALSLPGQTVKKGEDEVVSSTKTNAFEAASQRVKEKINGRK